MVKFPDHSGIDFNRKSCYSLNEVSGVLNWLFLYLVLGFLLFTGCTNHGGKPDKTHSETDNRAIRNTISKLDSLAFLMSIRNPECALRYVKTAIHLAKSIKSLQELCNAYNTIGAVYATTAPDSSFYYQNRALFIADSINFIKIKPVVFYNLSWLYSESANYNQALKLLDSSIYFAKFTKNYKILSSAYCSSGIIQLETGDSILAYTMFDNAKRIAKDHGLPKEYGQAIGNLARLEKNSDKAIKLNKEAIVYLKKVEGTGADVAMILINIGVRQTNPDSAIIYYLASLKLAEKGTLPLAVLAGNNNLAYYYLDKGLPDKASDCILNKAIPIAVKTHNDDWLSTLYDTYSDILAAKGDFKNGLEYEKKSNKLQLSVFDSKNKQQIRLLTAILDLKNKELTIKNTNLELQKKTNQNKILIIALLLSILILIIGIVIFRTSRQKAELQLKQEQITSARRIIELQETERTIIGQDLHDNIGYLVRIINGVFQSIDIPDKKFKSEISGKIVELEDHVRRISHRMSILNIDDYSDFKELAEDIINDFSNITGIKINYYIQEQIPAISGEVKIHLSRIIQELLTNSAKYAPDADIKIDIACETDTVLIIYKDNGPGFNKENKTRKAIGLSGLQERVKLLGGIANLNTGAGLGTSWEISIPIQHD